MQATITKDETKLRAEHCRHVAAIDSALSSLESALTAEREYRAKLHKDDFEFAATIPPLKLSDHVKLCSTGSRDYFEYVGKWRTDAISRGLLKKEA